MKLSASFRSILFAIATFAFLASYTPAQAANGVHTEANQTVNTPQSNEGTTGGTPVQPRERQPLGPTEESDEDKRRRNHARAARATLIRKREREINDRLANGEILSEIESSLEEVPSEDDIMASPEKSQEELLADARDEEVDAIGRPLRRVPTAEEVRLAGYAPEGVDRVIADSQAARDLQIEEAEAEAKRRETAGEPVVTGSLGQGPKPANAATFAARGDQENQPAQEAANSEKTIQTSESGTGSQA